MDWREHYEQGLPYTEFLARYGTDEHRRRWQRMYDQVRLPAAQREMLAGFPRQMHLLCLAGTWCGDCVRDGAILQRIAEAAPRLGLRFLDRDENLEVARQLAINEGLRVPIVVFLSEDFVECARYGERTLATYRKMAVEQLGGRAGGDGLETPVIAGRSGPGPVIAGAPSRPEEYYAAVVQDWMDEIERVQLLLRLSPRLRDKHGD